MLSCRYIFKVILFTNKIDTRRTATFHLVFNTRSRTISKSAIGTISKLKNFLQLFKLISYKFCAGIWAVIILTYCLLASFEMNRRISMLAVKKYKRISFIVSKKNIKFGFIFLNKLLFKNECLSFRMRGKSFHSNGLLFNLFGLAIFNGFSKVRAHTLIKILSLSNIDNFFIVKKLVYPCIGWNMI